MARDHLIDFTEFTMPHPSNMDDADWSLYKAARHHHVIAEALERVARGAIPRLAISVPPQHGKSELASRRLPAWIMGRNPHKNLIFATYSQDFAATFGTQVRDIIQSANYAQIFPKVALSDVSRSKTEQRTTSGGSMIFAGKEGGVTGRPADVFIFDDPIKDDVEAQSPTERNKVWEFFTKVAYARCHGSSVIVIIQTRWHEDDLVGRLCDPDHPGHDPDIAKDWTYINIPAILDENHKKLAHALQVPVGSALWPERFPLSHLETARKMNPRGFSALYMGQPTPEDGSFWTSEMLVPYTSPRDLPSVLRFYGASDHAVTEKQENDASVLGCFGVDSEDHIWIMPDVVWARMEADETVENWIALMKRYQPYAWFAENDIIAKAIGPFLRRRMREERVYTSIIGMTPSKSKTARSRSSQGRGQMRMIHFPAFASWWPNAKRELLKFPNATHDDFVDFISWIGLGLDQELSASVSKEEELPKEGTFGWVKWAAAQEKRRDDLNSAMAGW